MAAEPNDETVQEEKPKAAEGLFGRLVVDSGKATTLAVSRCLEVQEAYRQRGQHVGLGEIMVHEGYLTHEEVREILRSQQKQLYQCRACGRKFNVIEGEGDRRHRCAKCGRLLERVPDSKRILSFTAEITDREEDKPTAELTRRPAEPTRVMSDGDLRKAMNDNNPTVVQEEEDVSVSVTGSDMFTDPSVTLSLADSAGVHADLLLRGEADGPQLEGHGATSTKYYIEQEIARGGMGKILIAVDRDLRRRVAMKLLLPGTSATREQLERFLEEAQATGQLEHPNIIPIHEMGIDRNGRPFFTMKLVKGISLKEVIDELWKKRPSFARKYTRVKLLQTFLQICNAMSFAHSKGVVHRDLKPENVMIGDYGEVLVMDWGLAKVLGRQDLAEDELVETIRSQRRNASISREGKVAGTPAYMPPEQASGKISEIDERSDVYSLGAILYEMLSFYPPFEGSCVSDVITQVLKNPVVPPSKKNRANKIPRELNAICNKALSKDKEQRYQSVADIAQDVQNFIEERPVSAHHDPVLQRVRKWIHRHEAVSGSIVAAIIAVVLVSFQLSVREVGDLRAHLAIADERLDSAYKVVEEMKTLQADVLPAGAELSTDQVRRLRVRAAITGAAYLDRAHLPTDADVADTPVEEVFEMTIADYKHLLAEHPDDEDTLRLRLAEIYRAESVRRQEAGDSTGAAYIRGLLDGLGVPEAAPPSSSPETTPPVDATDTTPNDPVGVAGADAGAPRTEAAPD